MPVVCLLVFYRNLVQFFSSKNPISYNYRLIFSNKEEINNVNKNKDIHMIKINVGERGNEKHQQISDEFNIQGFPTILGLNNGERMSEYNGARSTNAFVAYVKGM